MSDEKAVLTRLLATTKQIQADIAQQTSMATPTQKRRALAHLAGKSIREIAREENVQHSAVAKSLDSSAVTSWLGKRLRMSVRINGAEEESLLQAVLTNVCTIALDSTRTIAVGNSVHTVPDFRLRFEASMKLLELMCPPIDKAISAVENFAAKETLTAETQTREVRTSRRVNTGERK